MNIFLTWRIFFGNECVAHKVATDSPDTALEVLRMLYDSGVCPVYIGIDAYEYVAADFQEAENMLRIVPIPTRD